MGPVLLSPGKTLTDPLLLLIVPALIFLVAAYRRVRGDRTLRRLIGATLAALLLLSFLSTAIAERFLEWTLSVNVVRSRAVPEVIVVASGGSLPGPAAEFDVLSESSAARIVDGVSWWHEHPSARLILTGSDRTAAGPSIRTLELMRDAAIRRGVPAGKITVESRSYNTREHAVHIAQLPGITRTTRIGLVTSPWHMRRARTEFDRYFVHVIPRVTTLRRGGLILNDVIPSSIALRTTTRLLHEWLGIAWYALRS
ncbi:MAG TPA: YdcF family protein [Thermoanaerobaculia bacterium]